MKELQFPEISLILLIGPSSAGKSTFAKKYFLSTEVVSSDYCRGLVSDDENNLAATDAAFKVLHCIAEERLKLGKLTVIDALNLRKEDRAKFVQLAKDNYALASAIILETPLRKLMDRHEARGDRNFNRYVLERQHDDFKRSLKTIEREGFNYIYSVNPEDAEIEIKRNKLWNNKKNETGPFDIIGDVHGCFDELLELLAKLGYDVEKFEDGHYATFHPAGRRVIFLGDLTDRGNNSPEVLRLVMDMVNDEMAFCICGNHDDKLHRYLLGKPVTIQHGLEKTVAQLAGKSLAFKNEVKDFLHSLIAHYVFDNGRLVVAHAGLREPMHGRASSAVRQFCLFGETTGEIDAFGLPVRYNWAKEYSGKAMVVYGHTPIPETEWLNNTINIDTGCVFGGALSALRYPEKEIIQVKAKEVYCEPIRPIQIKEETQTAQQAFDDMLDIDVISGKKLIETKFRNTVIIREENAIAALEVMSRFAMNPKWLMYLPPTMSPPQTSKLSNFLEHPQEVFDYYLRNDIKQVICEEKHMGSRAIAIVCKSKDVAVKRFGLAKPALGTMYTRTGRKFFSVQETEDDFLAVLHSALTASNFWGTFNTDWVCLDGELMPWNAKAKELLIKQYAAVGSAASNGLSHTLAVLQKAKARGVTVENEINQFSERAVQIEKYITSYRNYCRETEGIEGLVYAPFHILATENKTHFDKPHTWHLENIQRVCDFNPKHLMVTANLIVDLENEESVLNGINWWLEMTKRGGEGMVVKPIDYITYHKGQMVQPAMKCRGSEYLRIIYGPEYDTPKNLEVLKSRNVKVKRELAIKEFTLGLESLDRFIYREPLRRIHECVFGVLALESEAVDPRL